ncbi:MAG: hypothetical protein ABWW65_06765 [Thermoprotei archaeon]
MKNEEKPETDCTAVFRVAGIGCASCIEPIKIHLFKHPSVISVKIVGYNVIVKYRKGYTLEKIIKTLRISEYYRVVEIIADTCTN